MIQKYVGCTNGKVSVTLAKVERCILVMECESGTQVSFVSVDAHTLYASFENSFSDDVTVNEAIDFFSPFKKSAYGVSN